MCTLEACQGQVPSSGGNGTLQRPLQHLYLTKVADRPGQQDGSVDAPETAPDVEP